jgi:hypothetical protein
MTSAQPAEYGCACLLVGNGAEKLLLAGRLFSQRADKSVRGWESRVSDPSWSPGLDRWFTEALPTMTFVLSAEHGCPCVILVSALRKVAGDRQLLTKVPEYSLSKSGTWDSHRGSRPDQHESRPPADAGPRCSLMIQLMPEV